MKNAWRRLSSLLKNKQKFLLIALIFVGVMGLSFMINQARSLSLHFGDEEDHIAFAYYVTQDYQLHKDLQNNHQPTVYFASAALQETLDPPNIYMLIKRHRQMMYMYGFVWSLILLLRFKTVGLVFILFFEFLKYFLLGNVNLMETWAVYPAVYLLASLWELYIDKKLPTKKELFWLGICSFLVIFNLIALWPWLVIMWLLFLIKLKWKMFWPVVGVLLGMMVLFNFLYPYDFLDWFRENVRNNYFYAIPTLSPYKSNLDWLKMVFFPFLAFFTKGSLQANFISLFVTGWLAYLFYLIKNKDKQVYWFFILYLLLLLANNRVLDPGAYYYHGFHLLPWVGMMILVFVKSIESIIKKAPTLKPVILIGFGVWSLALFLNKNMLYFSLDTDVNHEYYVNYSTLEDMNFAIRALVNPGDRLAVTANEPILYWKSGAELPTRQIVYGGWEPSVPELNETYEKVFYGDDPPEIIYGGDEPELLSKKYQNIRRDNKTTELFVRNDKYELITKEQWQALESRGFESN